MFLLFRFAASLEPRYANTNIVRRVSDRLGLDPGQIIPAVAQIKILTIIATPVTISVRKVFADDV